MPSINRVLSPAQFDRSTSIGRPATAGVASPPPTPEQTLSTINTIESRVQDTLSLGQSAPESVAQGASQLNEALQSLKTLTNSGPNASLSSVLERFQSETLPQNLERLRGSQNQLQSQIEALPANSPERQTLELQLQAVNNILDLYQQAQSLLSSSPVLNPEAADSAVTDNTADTPIEAAVTASPEAVEAPEAEGQAPAEAAAIEDNQDSPDSLILAAGESGDTADSEQTILAEGTAPELNVSGLLNDGVIPTKVGNNFRDNDAFFTNPNSPRTIFNQRQQALQQNIQTVDTQIASLRQQGGNEDEIARLERIKPLLQNLSDLYGSISSLNGSNSRAIEADAQQLTDRIQSATQALASVATDIDTASFESIQGQLSDLSAITTAYVQLKDRPATERTEHNLGRFINTTYKRLGEIQIGNRVRANEPQTIAGALQTYANDRSDLTSFIQRFGDLREQIRSGRLTPEQARAQALNSIPGTSNVFQSSYLKLVDAEVALEQARQANLAAQRQLTSARENTAAAQGQIGEANQATATGEAASQDARAAIGRSDVRGASTSNQNAQAAQVTGQNALVGARVSLDRAQADRNAADANLGNARNLEARARSNADQVAAGAFGRQLDEPVQGVRGRADQVRSEVNATQTELNQVDAQIATANTELTAAEQANQALATGNSENTQSIERLLAERRAAENHNQLNQLDQFLDANVFGRFKIDLTAGVRTGIGGTASAAASLTATLSGEKNLEGTYAVQVAFGGEVSGEVKAWLFELEASQRFDASLGIRLHSAAEVRELGALLNHVTTSLTEHGITSSEASQARQQFLRFLQDHRETAVTSTTTFEAHRGHDQAEFQFVASDITTHRPGEHAPEETRKLAFEAEVEYQHHEYGVEAEAFIDRETGHLKYAQVSIGVDSNPTIGGVLAAVGGLSSLDSRSDNPVFHHPDFEAVTRQLSAQAQRQLPGQHVQLILSLDHHNQLVGRLATVTQVRTDVRTDIPVTPAASATVRARTDFRLGVVVSSTQLNGGHATEGGHHE